jgi:hypothetical protein
MNVVRETNYKKLKKKPKTDAQRSKEYRERQKIKKQTELQMKNTNHLHIYIIYSEYISSEWILKNGLGRRGVY